jgi:hypothetical protein
MIIETEFLSSHAKYSGGLGNALVRGAIAPVHGHTLKETLNKAGPALLADLSLIRLTTLHNFAA